MFYDAAKRDHGLALDPLKSLIVPRPIALVTTLGADGVPQHRVEPAELPAGHGPSLWQRLKRAIA